MKKTILVTGGAGFIGSNFIYNKDVKVNRVTTEEYGASIAKRPNNSRLDKSKLKDNGFKPLPDWKDALSRYLKEIKEEL